MQIVSDPIDLHLLDNWQRDFPLVNRPFARIATDLEIDEAEVITRLKRMKKAGRITRVGATCAPNTVSASTLAAVAAPHRALDRVAQIIGAEPGVNHSYERENDLNLWFVATGPDRTHIDKTLDRITELTGLRVFDFPLVRPFNVDLGFRMNGGATQLRAPRPANLDAMRSGDRRLLQLLTTGLPITAMPYADVADQLGISEAKVLKRIAALTEAGIISRFGVIVRHRALGWSANAMVVWDIAPDRIAETGPRLAALPGVTLCYERRPASEIWPYRLYNMIHARSRTEAMDVLDRARALPELQGVDHEVLFSTRCFKQTGALISLKAGKVA
ncbi:AsnC family transcriptional regulator [Seohaeicola saemankumensis]|nr:AsnC family transcriptional regulator [Seohaeicola saemankumensis]MCA0872479.1 AsnC family transcriptional regulator [Seohaeicola saemankumensis]